jgi:hypothetical protein
MSSTPKPRRESEPDRELQATEPVCQGFVLHLKTDQGMDFASKLLLSRAVSQMATIICLRVVPGSASAFLVCERLERRQAPASRQLINMRRNHLLLWALNQPDVHVAGVTGVFDAMDFQAVPMDPDAVRWYVANDLAAEVALQRAAWWEGSSAEMLAGLQVLGVPQDGERPA